MTKLTRLGDVVDLLTGFPFKSADFVEESTSTRLLRGDNIAHGTLRWDGVRYWPRDKVSDFDKYTLVPGDVIVAMDRPWISSGLKWAEVRDTDLPCLLVQRVARLRAKGPLEQSFLPYLISGKQFSDYVQGVQTGTAVPHISSAQIEDFRFRCPSGPEQRAIAAVLGALDDKIAINERIAVAADALAKAHYKREQYDLIGEPELLGRLARVVVGSTPSRAKPEYWSAGTVNWINSGKANEFRVIEPSEMITEEGLARSSVKLMPPGATLIGITGATMGQVSRLEITAGGSQNVAGVWSEDPALNDWLFYDIRARVAHLTKHASGGAQQHINKKIITDLVCVVPDAPRLAAWSAKTSPLLKYAAHALVESRAISILRDTLLPQLMSGRLRVKGVEKIVEDHT